MCVTESLPMPSFSHVNGVRMSVRAPLRLCVRSVIAQVAHRGDASGVRSGITRRSAMLMVCLLTVLSGCQRLTNPTAQVELQQSLYDLQDLLVQMREETALLQGQVDSLQRVVAKQDTSLRQIANLLGAPIR
jgi:hypothetical protein